MTDQAVAMDIVRAMDGLPLALDQAGAYIEETGESLSNYLTIYQQQRAELLKRRGGIVPDHPSVATTWSAGTADSALKTIGNTRLAGKRRLGYTSVAHKPDPLATVTNLD